MIEISIDREELHIILTCMYIPWWDYKTRLPKAEFEFQQKWIDIIQAMRDDENMCSLKLTKEDLIRLISLVESGLKELIDSDDFHTIVGKDPEEGKALLAKLKSTLN